MLARLKLLLRLYVGFLMVFFAAKLAFFFFNTPFERGASLSDIPEVLFHGLPLDLSTSAYLSALPWLALLVTLWWRMPFLRKVFIGYAGLLAPLLSLIFVADTCLYSFWDFKLDGTVFNYLDSPQGAAQSVTPLYLLGVVVGFLLTALLIFCWLKWLLSKSSCALPTPQGGKKRFLATLPMLLVGGLLFLAIRGGVGRSTANVGMVYYSHNQYLNHAAVNPAFSIFYSLQKTKDYASQCEFFEEPLRADLFASLQYDTASVAIDTLLTTSRPNVLLILMEGCGSGFVEAVGGKPDIMPRLSALAREGVLFSACHANSFRTDRGIVCALSGYPSFPDLSVMKLPAKSRTLPSIARTLQRAGYATEFLYGGDKNFTNMNSYLMATGYERTWGDVDFPVSVRRTHAWGVTDAIAFDTLSQMIARYPIDRPWHTTFLTLASHEPWGVPCDRIPSDERANAFAYLDDCIGRFFDSFRQTEAWKNTLVVLLPDHGMRYPDTLHEGDTLISRIPMVWTGGAVRRPRVVSTVCNQTDLAATLLGQLGLPHGDFRFSRDILSQTYRYPSAIHTWSGGFTFIDSTGYVAFDLTSSRLLAPTEADEASTQRLQRAQSFLQTAYDDLGAR